MATVENVQELLRNLGRVTKVEQTDSSFLIEVGSATLKLCESDVDNYLAVRDKVILQPETSVFIPGYYERLVDFLGASMLPDAGVQLTSQDGTISFDLSLPSPVYLLSILDKLDRRLWSSRGLRTRMTMAQRFRDSNTPLSLSFSEGFRRMRTIKVSASEQFRDRSKPNALLAIAEACLFNISYAKGVGLNLSRSWEPNSSRFKSRRNFDVQFPRRTYEADLLAYYQLALSSDSLMLAYIALYKILEYFFLSTAEAVLHKRLTEKLAAPDFTHRQPSQLRSLVKIVRNLDQKTNEQRMLTNVLEQNFMSDEIVSWVEQFESENGKYYTVSQSVFGLSTTFDTNTEKVAPSLAERIYHIRNVLVHNKEGKLPRFIPFAGHEDVLEKELPIMVFLAEQLIIKKGEDL